MVPEHVGIAHVGLQHVHAFMSADIAHLEHAGAPAGCTGEETGAQRT